MFKLSNFRFYVFIFVVYINIYLCQNINWIFLILFDVLKILSFLKTYKQVKFKVYLLLGQVEKGKKMKMSAKYCRLCCHTFSNFVWLISCHLCAVNKRHLSLTYEIFEKLSIVAIMSGNQVKFRIFRLIDLKFRLKIKAVRFELVMKLMIYL